MVHSPLSATRGSRLVPLAPHLAPLFFLGGNLESRTQTSQQQHLSRHSPCNEGRGITPTTAARRQRHLTYPLGLVRPASTHVPSRRRGGGGGGGEWRRHRGGHRDDRGRGGRDANDGQGAAVGVDGVDGAGAADAADGGHGGDGATLPRLGVHVDVGGRGVHDGRHEAGLVVVGRLLVIQGAVEEVRREGAHRRGRQGERGRGGGLHARGQAEGLQGQDLQVESVC